jgi:hypothetical protein
MGNSNDVIINKTNQVLFITELDLKTFTPLSANKVQTSMVNHIMVSQDVHIKKILGTVLYDKLKAEWVDCNYNANALPAGDGVIPPIISGDTTDYAELYQQIRMPLIWWSYCVALPNIAIRVEESGVMLNKTDYSESSGIVGLNRLVDEAKMVASSYTQILKDYMCTTFPTVTDTKNVGTNPLSIFVGRKPWHGNRGCRCDSW